MAKYGRPERERDRVNLHSKLAVSSPARPTACACVSIGPCACVSVFCFSIFDREQLSHAVAAASVMQAIQKKGGFSWAQRAACSLEDSE